MQSNYLLPKQDVVGRFWVADLSLKAVVDVSAAWGWWGRGYDISSSRFSDFQINNLQPQKGVIEKITLQLGTLFMPEASLAQTIMHTCISNRRDHEEALG